MQRWIASATTATPRGRSTFSIASRDLHGEPLLHLEPAREHLDEARDLREPDDAAVRDVRDVDAPEERQQVVLAQAVEVDVLHEDHLVVADLEQRVVQDRDGSCA